MSTVEKEKKLRIVTEERLRDSQAEVAMLRVRLKLAEEVSCRCCKSFVFLRLHGFSSSCTRERPLD